MFDPLVPDTRKGAAAQQSPCRRGRATRAAAVGAGWRTSTASRATVAASRSTGSAADAIPRRRSGGRYSASVESKLVAIGVCVCVCVYIYIYASKMENNISASELERRTTTIELRCVGRASRVYSSTLPE